jgi:hypothetical protein
MDWNNIAGLLHIVEKSNLHPKLASLGQLAMKELEGHAADAKKAHDEIIADENKKIAAKRQDELKKQQTEARKDEHSAKLTSQPQEVKKPEPPKPIARPAEDFVRQPAESEEPEADTYPPTTEPVRRRDVPAEVE